jgi:fatty acid desaturase
VTKNRIVQRVVGYCGLGLFCLSPTLWTAWHNQAHHGNTGNAGRDPDAFGTLTSWHESAGDRAVEKAAPGTRSVWSAGFLFYTFSVHSLV